MAQIGVHSLPLTSPLGGFYNRAMSNGPLSTPAGYRGLLRLALILALASLGLGLGAQEIFSEYLSIQAYANLPLVRLANVEEAARLAQKTGANRAFVRWSPEDKVGSELLFEGKGVFYVVDLKGFRTLGDFRSGGKGKFATGGDFYKAKALGIVDYELFRYWSRNAFLSLGDCKKALAGGFSFEGSKADFVILPLQVPKAGLEDFLKALPFLKPCFGQAQTPPGQGQAPGTGPRLEAAYRQEASSWQLVDPSRRVLKAYQGLASRPSLMEYQVYYLAQASGIGKLEDYAPLYEAYSNGYASAKDYAEASAKGFKSGAAYYASQAGGFSQAEDYALALDYGVSTASAYKPLKDFWDRILKTAQAESKPFGDAAIATVLSLLPRGKAYAIASIVEFADKGILVTDKFRKLLGDKGYQNTETAYLSFFRKYPDSQLGAYIVDSGTFTRQ